MEHVDNPTLPMLVYDWAKKNPIKGVIAEDQDLFIDFRCTCTPSPMSRLLATVYEDHAVIWSDGRDYHNSKSYAPGDALLPEDPLFFDKLREMLVAQTLRCTCESFK